MNGHTDMLEFWNRLLPNSPEPEGVTMYTTEKRINELVESGRARLDGDTLVFIGENGEDTSRFPLTPAEPVCPFEAMTEQEAFLQAWDRLVGRI